MDPRSSRSSARRSASRARRRSRSTSPTAPSRRRSCAASPRSCARGWRAAGAAVARSPSRCASTTGRRSRERARRPSRRPTPSASPPSPSTCCAPTRRRGPFACSACASPRSRRIAASWRSLYNRPMATFTVGDNELYYERSGAGEPLLLIMGMSGTHLSWGGPFLDALRRDFEIVIYDHRGMGKSARTEPPFTIVDLAEDAVALLDELGWDTAHVMGISMGGMIAQELALRHPDRVRTLTLGCTYAGGPGATLTSQDVGMRLFEAMQSGDRERALRVGWEVNVSARFAAESEQFAEFRRRALEVPANVPTIMAQMQAIMPHDTSGRLGEIRAPTLVIHGTEDEMLSHRNGEAIAAAIPNARVEIMDGVGHLFFWEGPERSAERVRSHARAGAAR